MALLQLRLRLALRIGGGGAREADHGGDQGFADYANMMPARRKK